MWREPLKASFLSKCVGGSNTDPHCSVLGCHPGLEKLFRRTFWMCTEWNPKPKQQTTLWMSLIMSYTLPETNSSHLKIGHPKRKVVFQPSIFRGYVSFREGKLQRKPTVFASQKEGGKHARLSVSKWSRSSTGHINFPGGNIINIDIHNVDGRNPVPVDR